MQINFLISFPEATKKGANLNYLETQRQYCLHIMHTNSRWLLLKQGEGNEKGGMGNRERGMGN